MKTPLLRRPTITVAQRGQIIQRVIVDGWSSAAAAEAFGVPTRLVDVWVADFRQDGMASLRRGPATTLAAEMVQLTVMRPIRAILRKIPTGPRRFSAMDPLARPLLLRRSIKGGPR
jgi:transposase-like protein